MKEYPVIEFHFNQDVDFHFFATFISNLVYTADLNDIKVFDDDCKVYINNNEIGTQLRCSQKDTMKYRNFFVKYSDEFAKQYNKKTKTFFNKIKPLSLGMAMVPDIDGDYGTIGSVIQDLIDAQK